VGLGQKRWEPSEQADLTVAFEQVPLWHPYLRVSEIRLQRRGWKFITVDGVRKNKPRLKGTNPRTTNWDMACRLSSASDASEASHLIFRLEEWGCNPSSGSLLRDSPIRLNHINQVMISHHVGTRAGCSPDLHWANGAWSLFNKTLLMQHAQKRGRCLPCSAERAPAPWCVISCLELHASSGLVHEKLKFSLILYLRIYFLVESSSHAISNTPPSSAPCQSFSSMARRSSRRP